MQSELRRGRIDMVLLLTVFVLLVFSIVMITSIGVPKSISLTKPAGMLFPSCGEEGVDCFFLLRRHVIRIGIGILAMALFFKIPIRFWRKIAIALFVLIFFALVSVLIFGSSVNTTAKAWFIFYSTSFQPAEAAKLILIFYLATWMERKGRDITDFRNGFLSFCAVTGMMILPVLLQPDFGSTLLFTAIATAIYFVAGARIRHLAVGLLIIFIFTLLVVPNISYLKYRFTAFLNPTIENCQPVVKEGETRRNYCWQTEQAKIAVGSGGVFGKGLTQGIQKSYWLPQATDDFIFAATAEELGFLRIIFIVIAYIIIAYRGFMIASYAPDRFSMLIAAGITTWFIVQAFVNIGVNIGLMPVTGITLPFISYGGTSMLVTLAGVGVLLQISQTTTHSYANSFHRRRDRGARFSQSRGH
ncbi:cell division protein FtsW [Candidatus Peregrinibacteria bacterium]|nr:cell division protein FtsW [Candidatus Peregrinibacteria bacterium]